MMSQFNIKWQCQFIMSICSYLNFINQRKITKVIKKKIDYFYIKGIIGLTAVYIKKVVRSNVITSKKNRFFLNIYKLYFKILLASKIKYVYKTDKDKFVKNFFKNY